MICLFGPGDLNKKKGWIKNRKGKPNYCLSIVFVNQKTQEIATASQIEIPEIMGSMQYHGD